jgi:hypothetical protein
MDSYYFVFSSEGTRSLFCRYISHEEWRSNWESWDRELNAKSWAKTEERLIDLEIQHQLQVTEDEFGLYVTQP